MSVKKIKIMRTSHNGGWDTVWITVFTETFYPEPHMQMFTTPDDNENEDEAVIDLFNDIAQDIDLEHFRSQVLQAHNRLRENDLSGNSQESIEIPVVPEELEPHQSCKENNENVTTMQTSEENGISQSEVKQKLANFSKSMKFFEDNKCPVCLRSYKEIIEDNIHIVIPSCGHPLCCECADNILIITNKECPRCRGNITAESFNLMKFNADLDIVTQDQKVFL